MIRSGRGAADLLRRVGLLADGPAPWGRPVSGRGPGIYVVELPAAPAVAPIDIGRVGAWLSRRPELRLDGARPAGKELAARVAAFWLPGEPVLFAGSTSVSIGGRVAALVSHVPGDRKPHAEGQWLHVLSGLSAARVWWASTDAPDEALDVFLTAFADGLDPASLAGLPDRDVILPFAVTRRPTGERKRHGITGAIAAAESVPPRAAARLTELEPADAEGVEETTAGTGMQRREVLPPPGKAVRRRPEAGSEPARRSAPPPATPRKTVAGRTAPARSPGRGRSRTQGAQSRPIAPTVLTAEGLERLRAEHEELTRVRRPAVINRIRTAREHGDLSENAEYHAAREEQSFLEGRVQAIEAILRHHVVTQAPPVGHDTVHLGSKVTIEDAFGQVTYTIVGSTEANPAEGRISSASPVGAALLGREVGHQVTVRTPRGEASYRIVAIE